MDNVRMDLSFVPVSGGCIGVFTAYRGDGSGPVTSHLSAVRDCIGGMDALAASFDYGWFWRNTTMLDETH